MLLAQISIHCSIHTHQMNILVEIVDNIPHARVMDFGIAIVTKNLDSIRPPTRQDGHTPRWSAPEILREQNPSKESDIYSFGMVTIEVYREWSEMRVAYANLRCINTGTHWRGSVQWREDELDGLASRVEGRPTFPAGTSFLHGRFVGIDPALLGPGP